MSVFQRVYPNKLQLIAMVITLVVHRHHTFLPASFLFFSVPRLLTDLTGYIGKAALANEVKFEVCRYLCIYLGKL